MHFILGNLEQLDRLIQFKIQSLGWPLEAFLQLLLAAGAGGLVGLEREVRGRQAGFRTNLLVALGSALVMIVSTRFAFFPWPRDPGFNINVDPARIAYGVMTGIGFLGAGTILHHKGSVRGLTTAAALWCTAAIGLAAGLGMYLVVAFTCLLVLLALWLLDRLEAALPRLHYRDLILRRRWEPGCVSKTIAWLRDSRLQVTEVSFERTADLSSADVNARVAFPSRQHFYDFEKNFAGEGTYELIAARDV